MVATHEAPASGTRRKRTDGKRNDETRRLALLRRSGLFGGDTKGAVITRAVTFRELEMSYRLVHDTFVQEGYIRPTASGIRVRSYETDRQTATFAAMEEDQIVGVQSLVLDSYDLGLPSDMAFADEIADLRAGGKLVCEATNESVAPEYRRSAVPTEMMRALYAYAVEIGCNELITTVSPGHKNFYEYMGFEQAGTVRSYSDEIEDPVVLMAWHLDRVGELYDGVDPTEDTLAAFLKRFYITENPYIAPMRAWSALAEATFGDPHAVGSFFGKCPDLFDCASFRELLGIRRRLGEVAFALAQGNRKFAALSA